MKLTGGVMKGRKVSARGLGRVTRHGALRATSSKVREALFNILAGRIQDAVFVDLYAGSGTVGLEAMSRGASSVYFVEADRERASGVEALLEGCGCRAKARVVGMKAAEFIRKPSGDAPGWDIVFLDPPYRSAEIESVLPLLGEGRVLAEDAVVIVEHNRQLVLPEAAGVLRKRKDYRYGDTVLTLYERVSEDNE